ncbi:hypothetical protein [Euzebya tangerina]|uniref:hypothetical protein n=1 Tax=Euzebya tangerina TaxID=591198 RepID=UPI0013C32D41|nr:hypothetical protein [Euzebya tangerina]
MSSSSSSSVTLFALLLLGMAVAAALLILQLPALFTPEGGSPIRVLVLAWVAVALGIGALVMRPDRAA